MRNSVQGIILLLVYGVFGDEVKSVSVSVYEGESVTLHTDTVIKNDDKIYWRFGETHATSRLVQMIEYKVTYEDSIDGRFRDRLQISDTQSGDLTIKNMRVKFSGLYEAEIDSDTGTSYKRFYVTVKESPRVTDAEASDVKSVSVKEGESVTLQTDLQTQKGDLILWRFGDKNLLIAKGDMEDNKTSLYDDDDGRFSGRLKMNYQTGDLTITNIINSTDGVYKLKIFTSREPKYKTFSVSVSVIGGWSSGAVAGLCVFFLLVIAAVSVVGVILYRRKKQTDVYLPVYEEVNLILPNADIKPKKGATIEWKYNGHVFITGQMTEEDKVIRVINNVERKFKDNLILDVEYLTIKSILKEDAGLYEVKITNSEKTSHTKFHVDVLDKMKTKDVIEGHPLLLDSGVDDIQTDDVIEWRFEETLIAEIKRNNLTITQKDDEIFGDDRLQLKKQSGNLKIKDISMKHAGLYKIKIISSKGTSSSLINVSVKARVLTEQLGESVIIPTGLEQIKTHHEIEWKFKKSPRDELLLAKIHGTSKVISDYSQERFNGRLTVHPETGDLIIKEVTAVDTGHYILHDKTRKRQRQRNYYVALCVSRNNGELVILETGSELTVNTKVEWSFSHEVNSKFKQGLVTEVIEHSSKNKNASGRFRDRLKIDTKTGDLTIKNIERTDAGFYTLKLIKTDGEILYRIFKVDVRDLYLQISDEESSNSDDEENPQDSARNEPTAGMALLSV